jgi:hypothetical protein
LSPIPGTLFSSSTPAKFIFTGDGEPSPLIKDPLPGPSIDRALAVYGELEGTGLHRLCPRPSSSPDNKPLSVIINIDTIQKDNKTLIICNKIYKTTLYLKYLFKIIEEKSNLEFNRKLSNRCRHKMAIPRDLAQGNGGPAESHQNGGRPRFQIFNKTIEKILFTGRIGRKY